VGDERLELPTSSL